MGPQKKEQADIAEIVKVIEAIPKNLACEPNFYTRSFALLDYFASTLRASNPRIPIIPTTIPTTQAENKWSIDVWPTEKLFLETAFTKYTGSLNGDLEKEKKLLALDSQAILKQILYNTIREYHLSAYYNTSSLKDTQMREVYAEAYQAYLTLIVIPQTYIEYLFYFHNSSAAAITNEDKVYRERIIKALCGDNKIDNASEREGAISSGALTSESATTIWREIHFFTTNIKARLKINNSATTAQPFADRKQYAEIMLGEKAIPTESKQKKDLESERFNKGNALEYRNELKEEQANLNEKNMAIMAILHNKVAHSSLGDEHIPLVPVGSKAYNVLSFSDYFIEKMVEADNYFRSTIIPEYKTAKNFIYTQIGLCIIEAAKQSVHYKKYANAIEGSQKTPLEMMSILRNALAETKNDPKTNSILLQELKKYPVFEENGILPLDLEKAVKFVGQRFDKPSSQELKDATQLARKRYDEKTHFDKHQPIFGIAYWSLHHGLTGQQQANDVQNKVNEQTNIDEIMATLAAHLHHGPGGSREKSFKYNLEAVLQEQLATKYPEYWNHIKQIFKSKVDSIFSDDDLSSSTTPNRNRRESTSSTSSSNSSTSSAPGTPEYIHVVCMHLDKKIEALSDNNEAYPRVREPQFSRP